MYIGLTDVVKSVTFYGILENHMVWKPLNELQLKISSDMCSRKCKACPLLVPSSCTYAEDFRSSIRESDRYLFIYFFIYLRLNIV